MGKDIKGKKKTEIKIRDVPVELKHAFKARCARRRTNMSKVLRKFMVQCLAEDQ